MHVIFLDSKSRNACYLLVCLYILAFFSQFDGWVKRSAKQGDQTDAVKRMAGHPTVGIRNFECILALLEN